MVNSNRNRRRRQFYRAIQVFEHVHTKIGGMAKLNNVLMKTLASKMLEHMLNEHQNQIEQIIKEIKIRQGKS